ncbi:MAG: DEAD/DEAH box helicase family protein [Candidatus Poribacteria bacterium]|nr:DEAD/DEAH box helicase family protein [Candidatus Poribacteria bacterium]
MSDQFFKQPILNSPYEYPGRHWELDEAGQPTQHIRPWRRPAEFITPIPKPKQQKGTSTQQADLGLGEATEVSTDIQKYEHSEIINAVRRQVDAWRRIPNPNKWQVTSVTARLLQHWRHHQFNDIRPFFCQIEAVETAIWLTEVARKRDRQGSLFLNHLDNVNSYANPGLSRLALKLATGAGKTTVMAMLIAWQTINAVRHPQSQRFTNGFLVVTPGITIKDRLRVLQPNDPDSYYQSRELVPNDMLPDLEKARIVITNFHAFKLRDRVELSKGGRSLLQGRGQALETEETEGQMLQRVIPELMGMKNVVVFNDEAHHCYRQNPREQEEEKLKGEDKKEVDQNKEAARLWLTGLETVGKRLNVNRIFDLSATPFFLRGSGYAEGTLFPWTMNEFSLMDAIESGIVKLPRVPVSDNVPGGEMPTLRNLWEHIGKKMPKKGFTKANLLDPLSLPVELETALQALYGHYEKTFELMKKAGIEVPPCFIVVCNNTSTSKLVYDYISGFHGEYESGQPSYVPGRLELFRNYDENGKRHGRPRTLLIDSHQLESGDALDPNFRKIAADEIDRFRREIIERTGDRKQAEDISPQDLLREVMNTVGKPGRLGDSIRCVVSVSMLTEGWDANTVSHVLGVRAFGTQLLCEQVVGRALRRQSYDLNDDGVFNVEYADVLGIPFDFTAKPVVAPPSVPRETVHVKAMRPERDHLEIRFPRVSGYRVELPDELVTAKFTSDSVLTLTTDLVGPTITRNQGIIGEGIDLSLVHTRDFRYSSLVYNLTQRLLYTRMRDPGDEPKLSLFGQLKHITKEWLDECLVCLDDTYPAQLMYQELADMACERIAAAINQANVGARRIKAVMDPYNSTGSTALVNFNTTKTNRWQSDPEKCHVNWVVLDSDWEGVFCQIAESHPHVRSYVKNHNLGLEVPYRYGSTARTYLPDFIVLVDDGRGEDDLLHLVVEIKGYRGEDAKVKKLTMETYWVPGVNNSGALGRWAFGEFTDVHTMKAEFGELIEGLRQAEYAGVVVASHEAAV